MKSKIVGLANKYKDDLIAIRHHIHKNPELSFVEFKTSEFIQSELKKLDIPFEVKAQTGVIGIIKGKNPDKMVTALRADMDALPILEANDVSYRSSNDGVMHACGHDVHTTCLLGAARILKETASDWEGTVKLIFQPGEEKNPGGASLLIKEGVLENPKVDRIFALHVRPGMPVGDYSFRAGMAMASADEIYITIKVKGGHAAAPQKTPDSILIASQVVVSLQQVVSRNNDPFNPTVLSITSIQGGNTTNVIPSEVKLMGTLRAMNEEWRFQAHDIIKNHVESLVRTLGGEADVHIDVGYPFVLNNEKLTYWAKEKAVELVGDDKVYETELRMGAEDFAFYSHLVPACFFRIGIGNYGELHTPTFNIDENAIQHGVTMMAWLAVNH